MEKTCRKLSPMKRRPSRLATVPVVPVPQNGSSTRSSGREEERITRIHATIVVERDSQKAIVIGKGGEKIKQIGMAARLDIERFLGKKVFLELWCKPIAGWKSNIGFLRESRQSSGAS